MPGGSIAAVTRTMFASSNIYANPVSETLIVVGFAIIITMAVMVRIRNRNRPQ